MKEVHLEIYRKLMYIFVFALSFSTPSLTPAQGKHFIFNITPILLGLFLLNWLVEARFKEKFQRIKEKKWIFPFFTAISFYGICLIGLIYSPHFDLGKADILLKLPILLFPLLIFTMDTAMWKPKMPQNLLYTFALGNLFAVFISLIHSFLLCREVFSIHHFHYINASFFFHPSYASMYYCFSFVIVLYLLINTKMRLWKKATTWVMLLLFPAEIVLLDSRTGLFTFAVVILTFAAYMFVFQWKKRVRFVLYMSLLMGVLGTTYLLLPQNANRIMASFHQIQQNRLDESNVKIYQVSDKKEKMVQLNEDVQTGKINARAQTWVSAVEVIKEHPVCGVGTGSAKNALMEKYVAYNLSISQQKELNAHNQFLQVTVTLGFIGLAVFMAFLLSLFWIGWKKRNILLILFGLIVIINFCTESMLERQVGVMFFAFFFAVLSYIALADLLKHPQE